MKRKHGPHKVTVFSFGAGVQSTAILALACEYVLDLPDVVMFSDTGWEPRAVYEHMQDCRYLCEELGIDFRIVSNGNIREDILRGVSGERFENPPFFTVDDKGKVGMLMRKCTRHYKARPLDREITKIKKERTVDGVPPLVEQWFGISTDESQRMRDAPRGKEHWLTYRYPLIELDLSRSDCVEYLNELGITAPKSACIGCPYHSPEHWLNMAGNDLESWSDAVDIDNIIRAGINGTNAALFLSRTGKPLSELSGGETSDAVWGFNNDCEGLCGL